MGTLRKWLLAILAFLFAFQAFLATGADDRSANTTDPGRAAASISKNAGSSNGTAKGEPKERTDREPELPAVVVVDKPKASIDDAFSTMFVSNPYETKFGDKVKTGKDITDYEVAEAEKIINGSKDAQFNWQVPVGQRIVIHTRYHPGDKRSAKVLMDAKKKKFGKVGQISDMNDAVDGNFAPGQKIITSYTDKTITPKDNQNGQVITILRDDKFEYATDGKLPNYFLATRPINNKDGNDDILPLMHEKGWEFIEVDKDGNVIRAFSLRGSANEVPHGAPEDGKPAESTRYNRSFTINDPDIAKFYGQHALDLANNFAQGNEINKVAKEPIQRVKFQDGWVESGFTNGRNNMNARTTALILHGVKIDDGTGKGRNLTQAEVDRDFDKDVSSAFKHYAPEFAGWTIEEITSSDFVNTHTQTHRAEELLFKSDKKVIKTGIVDEKFTDPTGFGLSSAQNGLEVIRPMGGTVHGWTREMAERVKQYVYLRGVPGEKETDLEGPPVARYLWHDKTGILRGVLPNGQRRAVIRTGSFNHSNHKESAEDQRLINVAEDSWIHQAVRESIFEVIKNEPQFAIPYLEAIHLTTLAKFLGHSPLEVDRKSVEKISDHIRFGEFKEATKLFKDIAKRETSLLDKVELKEMEKRIDDFEKFLEFHKETFPDQYGERGNPNKSPSFYLRKILNIAGIASKKSMQDTTRAWGLRGVLWSPRTDPSVVEERAKTAWKLLGLPGEMPERPTHDDDKPSTPVVTEKPKAETPTVTDAKPEKPARKPRKPRVTTSAEEKPAKDCKEPTSRAGRAESKPPKK